MSDIPWDGYWRTAGQVFRFPLVTVFASSLAEARRIAGPDASEGHDYMELAMDSAEAQVRLGIFGRKQ